MMEIGAGARQDIDTSGREAEIAGLLFVQVTPALEHPAIHEDASPARRGRATGERRASDERQHQ